MPPETAVAARGESVLLAVLTEADLPLLHDWFVQSGPPRLTCRPWADLTLDRALARFRTPPAESTGRTFAVRRVADGTLLGRVAYFDLNPRNRAAEIGFMIGPPHRGRGYARAAVKLLLGHLFIEQRLNKAMAQTGAFNTASLRLLRELGFQQDGRLRQHHELAGVLEDDILMSLLHEEWEAAH